jgi:AcrR family transcriptional regulator
MVKSISEVRRDEITDAVLKILALQGSAAISIQVIADAVGMAKSSIYHHFAGVEELMDAALEKGQTIVMDYFHSSVRQASSPFQALTSFVSGVHNQSTAVVALERVVTDSSSTPNPWSDRVSRFRKEITEKLLGLVQEAQASGELRDDISTSDIVTTLLSLLVYQYVIQRAEETSDGLSAGVNSVISIFTKLIARHT